LDLSGWSFTEDGIIPLDGEWEIYWNALLEPSDFRSPGIMQAKEYFQVPGFWNKQIIGGEQADGTGFATLRLNVKVEGQGDLYRIRIIRVYTAYKAWVNGNLIASEGKVGSSLETSSPAFGLEEALVPDSSGNLEIILQISNYHHNKGGLRRKILLGHPGQIIWHGKTTMGYDIILFTLIFVLGFGVLWIFFYNPKERSTLYFGLACLFTVTHSMVVNEMPLVYYIEGIQWETTLKIDYLSNYLRAAFFVAFFRNIFPGEISRIFSRGVLIWAGVFSLIILLTKALFYTAILFLFEIIVGVVFLYLVYGLVMALIRRRKGAVLSAAGIFALMAAALNDILYSELIIHSRYLFALGLLICITTHTILLSVRFTELYGSVRRLLRRLLSLDKIKNAFIRNASRDNLESPFKTILQNASADKGFLYIWEESKWVLKVFMSLSQTESLTPPPGIEDFSAPVKDPSGFPYHMVRMAIEEKRNIAFTNAEEENNIQNDPYFRHFHIQSAFCMRIESEGTLTGLLYLENQHTEGAFSDETLEMLDLLSPQLTTMLDNI
ncbi:MAG: GAF domain-containing protein, partial [Bacteroidales bacterium]|nr:GAF domain-containing protein [Bacteroidales bacterium]